MPFARPEEQAVAWPGKLICPHCGKVNTAHAALGPDEVTPAHGDVSLCIRCGQLSVFDSKRRAIRVPTARELREFEAMPEIRAARRAWRKVVAH